MALDLQTVQRIDTALLNLAVAVLTGAAVVALIANLVTLWLESAAMAEVPVTAAGGAAWAMLTSTHWGVAWAIGMLALAAAAAGTPRLILCALAVFWYTRDMVSHAAGDGDFSLRLVADWVHLGLISLWVGEVAIAGVIAMQAAPVMAPDDRRARAAYVGSLSTSATFALAGIVVNRFAVMPTWLARESAGEAAPAFLPARFRHVLWIEGCVLLAAVVLAAWLASTSPPVEPM